MVIHVVKVQCSKAEEEHVRDVVRMSLTLIFFLAVTRKELWTGVFPFPSEATLSSDGFFLTALATAAAWALAFAEACRGRVQHAAVVLLNQCKMPAQILACKQDIPTCTSQRWPMACSVVCRAVSKLLGPPENGQSCKARSWRTHCASAHSLLLLQQPGS